MTEKMSNDNQFFNFFLDGTSCAATAQDRKGLQFQGASTSEKNIKDPTSRVKGEGVFLINLS